MTAGLELERQPLTPWHLAVPEGTAVELRAVRFPGRDHPRIVVALVNWTDRGFKRIHLTRPVAYVSRRGIPAWAYRSLAAVKAAIDGTTTASELATIAERAHRGAGIPKARW